MSLAVFSGCAVTSLSRMKEGQPRSQSMKSPFKFPSQNDSVSASESHWQALPGPSPGPGPGPAVFKPASGCCVHHHDDDHGFETPRLSGAREWRLSTDAGRDHHDTRLGSTSSRHQVQKGETLRGRLSWSDVDWRRGKGCGFKLPVPAGGGKGVKGDKAPVVRPTVTGERRAGRSGSREPGGNRLARRRKWAESRVKPPAWQSDLMSQSWAAGAAGAGPPL
eukprot:3468008-Rhodomonas_salina.1